MESKIKPSLANRWVIIDLILALIIIGFWLYASFVLHICVVTGESMLPTLNHGDIVKCKVDFVADDISRGDILVINTKEGELIKRVIALPGESIYIRNGQIYVGDGHDYRLSGYEYDPIEEAGVVPLNENDPLTLSPTQYFCIGDNRNNSVDCREIGPVEFDQIERIVIGKVFCNINTIL